MTMLRRIPVQYLWPLLLLLSCCFGSLLILLYTTTRSQDTIEADREVRTLQTALDTGVEMVRHDLQDYAKWDDAVRHVAIRFDPGWIDDNVTAYLGRTQGYDHVFVVGPDDATRYAFSRGERSTDNAVATLGPAFARSLARVRAMDPGGQPVVGGFTRRGDRLYVYAAAAIVPLTGKVALPRGGRNVMAIAATVDPAYLGQMDREHHLPRLSLVLDGPVPAQGLAIRDLDGRALAHVALGFRTPGAALRAQILPGFIVIMLVASIAAGLILRQGSLAMAALRASQARTLHHANHDPLTGLANRRVLLKAIGDAMAEHRAVTLLYMDLDGFKEVNDLYGHGAGDALLREVTARLTRAVEAGSPAGLIARTGGDEFAVLCPDAVEEGAALAAAIIRAFEDVFAVAGANMLVGVSIGVVAAGRWSPLDVDELIRRADVAMYHAKGSGKNRWAAFAPAMDNNHDLRKRLERDLHEAVATGAIEVAYQPVIASATGEVACVEALARWTHHREGPISPEVFIPLAEMTGLIGALGLQVLDKACRAVGPLGLDLAVNLSPAQFWDAHLVETVAAVLADTGFPAERLELEITENYLLGRPDAAAAVMDGLRALGIRIALDDFGTGYASIGYLQQFKFDRLKIDKQFVSRAVVDLSAAELLVAIVALGRALALPITAEGVETHEQAVLARACGCQAMQGWLFGRPGGIDALSAMLADDRTASAAGRSA